VRDYIFEKIKNTTKHFHSGDISVVELHPLPETINLYAILKALEENFPSHYFHNLDSIVIGHTEEFNDRDVNAVYRDNSFHITHLQQDTKDLMDDLVHEFAHHMETLFPEQIYSDSALIREFLKKRHELEFEVRSEGYWTEEYDFDNLKYDKSFDDFLYKRLGPNMLRMLTSGLFIRPYGAVSLREYFATGFEAYYLGKRESLEKISPILYNKITELHNSTEN